MEKEISINSLKDNGKDFWVTQNLKERNKQIRINAYHLVVHVLAFILVVPYIVLICFNYEIPVSYSTIVSIVIGFYFARSLFN